MEKLRLCLLPLQHLLSSSMLHLPIAGFLDRRCITFLMLQPPPGRDLVRLFCSITPTTYGSTICHFSALKSPPLSIFSPPSTHPQLPTRPHKTLVSGLEQIIPSSPTPTGQHHHHSHLPCLLLPCFSSQACLLLFRKTKQPRKWETRLGTR